MADPIFDKIYILFFRSGSEPDRRKNFYFDGNIREATRFARLHCQEVGYEFIYVKHFLSNLQTEEGRKELERKA